ncbi:putative xyloglucan endotransglucosylase/hydrolase protein 23 [Glycine soja]
MGCWTCQNPQKWGTSHLALSLDKTSGSGFRSRNEYLFGKFDMQIKLVPGNSAGTVTAYYLSSLGDTHDEIDFEFLGNLSGDPYILHSNVFTQGKGNREQQFYLVVRPHQGLPHIFHSLESSEHHKLQCSSCVWTSSSGSSCSSNNNPSSNQAWLKQSLDATGQARIQWVQKNYMIYNYCTDTKRFPQGLHPECTIA